jgi:hypothetical protein
MPRQPRIHSSACPYCFAVLEPPPARSGTCPRCGERIYVRELGARRLLVTEEGVRRIDAVAGPTSRLSSRR